MKALVLIDIEKEYFDDDSDYFVGDVGDFVKRVNQLVEFCRGKGYVIIFVRHIEEDGDAFIEGTAGVEFIDGIGFRDSDVVVEKKRVSSFFNTDMGKKLEGVDEVIVCGILTNLCVRSFVEEAYDRDFDIKVIRDCCVALDKESHEFTLRDLKETREEVEFLDLVEFIE
ncbi:cysteine hydrolase [Candidatus Pacearchaeota archaeon]|nr:cysteine hydrolase [Candidatus Pacearchaeota archaeon]